NRQPLAREDRHAPYSRRRHSDSHAEVTSRRGEKRGRHGRGRRNTVGERAASNIRVDPGASAWNDENRSRAPLQEGERAGGEGPAECTDLHAPGIEIEQQGRISAAQKDAGI